MCASIRWSSVRWRQGVGRGGSRAGLRSGLLLGALCGLACSSQVSPDYAGEPLAVLRGALAGDSGLDASLRADGMTVGLVWLVGSGDGQRAPMVAETASTEGEFPFGFRLTVYSPPAPETQSYRCPELPCTDPAFDPVYQGFVAALAEGADLEQISDDDILGVSLQNGVLYFERDADPNDPADIVAWTAAYYNVPAVRGYHLYTLQRDEAAYVALRRCEYNGLCVRTLGPGDDRTQSFAEREFEECLALVPDALSCTTYSSGICSAGVTEYTCSGDYFEEQGREPTADELAENERCMALSAERSDTPIPEECLELESPWQHPANPLGFDANISIQLGAGFYEWIN
jgi:hypothetical protein